MYSYILVIDSNKTFDRFSRISGRKCYSKSQKLYESNNASFRLVLSPSVNNIDYFLKLVLVHFFYNSKQN